MEDEFSGEAHTLTLQDALDSGALDVINDSDGQESFALLAALDALMVTKRAAGLAGQAEVVQLLKSCYSMRLDAGSKTEPFQPALRLSNGNTSAKPYHLPQEHIQLLAEAYNLINPAARRAHLADIVGLMIRKRRIDHVIAAIDAYMVTPLDAESWFDGGKQHWHRALALALSFRSGIGTRLDQIVNALFSAFEKACEGATDATAYSTAKWPPIPRESGHRFHGKLATDSTPIRPPIPRQSGHRFHGNPATLWWVGRRT